MPNGDRRPELSNTVGIGIAILQWVLLTIALGVMMVYTDRSMEGLLGLHLDSAVAFLGATIVGYLLGATINHIKLLTLMVTVSCAAAAGIYVALLFYPVWTGTLVHTVGLENFASTRALLYFGLSMVPVSFGAFIGHLTAGWVPGGDLLKRSRVSSEATWWLERPSRDDTPTESS